MKDIYELMNEVNIDDFEEMETNTFEKERVKKALKNNLAKERGNMSKKKNKKLLKVAGTIGVTIIASTIIIGANPTFASKIPIIGDFFQMIYGDKNSDFLKYSETIDKTISHGGIDLTFHSAVISNDTMILDFTLKNNNQKITDGNRNEALVIPTKVEFNGKDVPTGAGATWNQIDENTIRVLKNVDIGSDGNFASGKLNVQLFIDEVFGIKEDFGVKFKYDKSLQDKLSVIEDVNKTITVNGKKVVIEKASTSPLTSSIYTNVRDKDNSGLQFIAVDNNGMLLEIKGVNGSGSLNSYREASTFTNNKDIKSVTFIPYYDPRMHHKVDVKGFDSSKKVSFNLDNKNEITIMGTEDYGIKIVDYVKEGDYLVVKYIDIVLGKEGFRPAFGLGYLDVSEQMEWTPEQESIENKYNSTEYETRVFKVGDKKDLEFVYKYNSTVRFFEDDKITLNLPIK